MASAGSMRNELLSAPKNITFVCNDNYQDIIMPGLLQLPSELLFEIIGLVVSSTYPPGAYGKRYRPELLGSRNVVCYPETGLLRPSGLDLLLTCRRLHSETSFYFSKKPQAFKLDLAIVDSHWIWPSWRCIPIRRGKDVSNQLHVDILHCCTADVREDTDLLFSTRHNTIKDMFRFLNHVLLRGPVLDFNKVGDSQTAPKGLRFKQIVINIDTFENDDVRRNLSEEEVPFRRIEGLAHLDFDTLHPAEAEFCQIWIRTLAKLSITFTSQLVHQYAAAFHDRVDEIVFKIDRHNIGTLNIARDYRKLYRPSANSLSKMQSIPQRSS